METIQYIYNLILLYQIIHKLIITAASGYPAPWMVAKTIHGAWIQAIHAGMTILGCVIMKSDKVESGTKTEHIEAYEMNTAEKVYQDVKAFPEPLAQEVLQFVEFLKFKQLNSEKYPTKPP